MVKKVIWTFLIFLLVAGCSTHNKQKNPNDMLNNIIQEDYSDSNVLCQKNEKDYYAALIENEKLVSLIILKKNQDNTYEFFGEANYTKGIDNYGRYEYGDDNTLVIVFSKNTEDYDALSLNFKNLEKENETLIIQDKINKNSCMIDFFILPSNYSLINTSFD